MSKQRSICQPQLASALLDLTSLCSDVLPIISEYMFLYERVGEDEFFYDLFPLPRPFATPPSSPDLMEVVQDIQEEKGLHNYFGTQWKNDGSWRAYGRFRLGPFGPVFDEFGIQISQGKALLYFQSVKGVGSELTRIPKAPWRPFFGLGAARGEQTAALWMISPNGISWEGASFHNIRAPGASSGYVWHAFGSFKDGHHRLGASFAHHRNE
jgi:hypothetical protein